MAALADEALFEGLWALVESQSVVAAAALLMHGVFLILFVLAMFFMLRNRAEGQLILLFTAVLMAGFAIVQVALDVSLATLASSFFHITTKEGMSPHALSLMNMFSMGYKARQGILATNNAVADCLLLYRCYLIWATSSYARIVVAIPLIMILATAAIAYVTIQLVLDIRIPFSFALLTNLVLFSLAAGRIWYKRRQAAVLQDTSVHKRYTATLGVVLESGLLYVAAILIYVISISKSVPPFTTFQNICWGSLAQLVNIVPMLILVRGALAKAAPAPSDEEVGVGSTHKEMMMSATHKDMV
ncbi:hypothetical protein B0H14DRAFT_2741094 [Mycena olivaceomarginata]|nr:hypothetical protein B0H14DRAFT_2741094 [Mycena olivaceomarginata]